MVNGFVDVCDRTRRPLDLAGGAKMLIKIPIGWHDLSPIAVEF